MDLNYPDVGFVLKEFQDLEPCATFKITKDLIVALKSLNKIIPNKWIKSCYFEVAKDLISFHHESIQASLNLTLKHVSSDGKLKIFLNAKYLDMIFEQLLTPGLFDVEVKTSETKTLFTCGNRSVLLAHLINTNLQENFKNESK